MAGTPKPKPSLLNPAFKLIAIINGVICAGCLIILVLIAIAVDDERKFAGELFEVCKIVFCSTTGAFAGMMGGKVSAPDPVAAK